MAVQCLILEWKVNIHPFLKVLEHQIRIFISSLTLNITLGGFRQYTKISLINSELALFTETKHESTIKTVKKQTKMDIKSLMKAASQKREQCIPSLAFEATLKNSGDKYPF